MADTERSLATILALLADNGTGNISAQDLRDAVVSILPDYGNLYISTAAATTLTTVDTYYEAAGTTTLGANVSAFDMPANGRLRYTGAPTRIVLVTATISMTASINSQVLDFRLAKNGTTDVATEVQRKIGTGSDVGAASVSGILSMATNDYVSLFAENTTSGGTTVTLTKMSLVAQGTIS